MVSTQQNQLDGSDEGSDHRLPNESDVVDSGFDNESPILEVVEEVRFTPSSELKELADKWFAEIGETGKLINNRITMTRKDYIKHTKNLTRDKLLEDPLLYILFRSEEQGEANFFMWLEKFPKAKDESK